MVLIWIIIFRCAQYILGSSNWVVHWSSPWTGSQCFGHHHEKITILYNGANICPVSSIAVSFIRKKECSFRSYKFIEWVGGWVGEWVGE